jgi:hypothetical protein
MNEKFISTVFIYSNKWRFYLSPVIDQNNEILQFNWFFCGRPFIDKKGNKVIEIGSNSLFFDTLTGKTFHIKNNTEKCILKINNSQNNIKNAILEGYCGVAIYKKCKKLKECNFLCENAVFIFKSTVLERSDKCPYIRYAINHNTYLKTRIKNFPSKEILERAKPGQISLKLKKMLEL